MDASDWTAAERDLRAMIARDGNKAEPHLMLGYVFFRAGRPADSLAEYTAAAALEEPTVDDLIVVSSDYILLKDYADAERWLRYATKHFSANSSAWYLLGRTQYKLDHADDATSSFQRCVQLSPDDLRAEYNLGLALEKLSRPVEAETAYRKAIAIQQKTGAQDPQPYLDLGTLLMTQHRNDEALAQLRQAAVLGPTNAMVHQRLGLALEATGRDAEAVLALERATALAPGAEQPHFFLGRIYRRLGRNEDAAAQFAAVQSIYRTHTNKETPNEPPLSEQRP